MLRTKFLEWKGKTKFLGWKGKPIYESSGVCFVNIMVRRGELCHQTKP